MKITINQCERAIVECFKKLKYPAIYKLDDTDNILFVERVDFDICSRLLSGKMISDIQYREIIGEYKIFLSQVQLNQFDEYALIHYDILTYIMKLFEKYYCNLT